MARIKGGKKLDRHFQDIDRMGRYRLKVGFFKSATYDPNQLAGRGGPRKGKLFVATVAAWNEFGTRRKDGSTHIPERPFFRNALKVINPKIGKYFIKAMRAGMRRKNFKRFFELLGLVSQGEIQKSIRDLKTPPNAPATLRRKTVGGKVGDNPLIDTGTMVTSVTYGLERS